MVNRRPIYVTKPILPPLKEVLPYLEEIWDSRILSNNGPLLQRFETALVEYLDTEHISVVTNGTLGLLAAMHHYGITSGEVITTPFSFVATSQIVKLAGATPVFADIDPVTLNLDPDHVERLITPQTRAILAVHCFGTPCDTAALQDIAQSHNLPLLYDAAHAFGVRHKGRSILDYGDVSVLSFHATKVFNTFEGGAVISRSREDKLAIDQWCNFNIVSETQIDGIGLNAKMSELSAAMGLALLPHMDQALNARADVIRRYIRGLNGVAGIVPICPSGCDGSNSYAFPILVTGEFSETRDTLYERLKANGFHARRYFYPLISSIPAFRNIPSAQPGQMPVAERIMSEVLCLPLYPDLAPEDQDELIALVCG